jgi:hypothetical protein
MGKKEGRKRINVPGPGKNTAGRAARVLRDDKQNSDAKRIAGRVMNERKEKIKKHGRSDRK